MTHSTHLGSILRYSLGAAVLGALASGAAPAAAQSISSSSVVARFTSGGALDMSFPLSLGTPSANSVGRDIAKDSQGRFVTCGYVLDSSGTKKLVVGRFLTNGQPDTGFGLGGVATLAFSQSVDPAACVTDSSNRVVVLANIANTTAQWWLVRFTAAGAGDGSFGIGGLSATSFPNATGGAGADLAIMSDQSIVAVGSAGGKTAVARYNPNGVPNGLVQLLDGEAHSVAIDSNDKTVLVGTLGASVPMAARLLNVTGNVTAASALDPSFGNGAFTPGIQSLTSPLQRASALAVDSSGGILIAGTALTSGGASRLALERLTPTGVFDSSFNLGAGINILTTPNKSYAAGITLDLSGNILVVGGNQPTGSSEQGIIARFTFNGQLDTFGASGVTALQISHPTIFTGVVTDGLTRPVVSGSEGVGVVGAQ